MKLPLQITWRGISQSDAIETAIREKADKLEQFYDKIMACRVTVDAPHQHGGKGNLYEIHLDITVPGGEIVVRRNPTERHAHEDIYVVIRDVFDEARRQLQDHARKERGDVKAHGVPRHARVLKKFPAEDYGVLETPDGREIYFHKNALIDGDFSTLHEGTEVLYVEEQGNEGPEARQVVLGKHAWQP